MSARAACIQALTLVLLVLGTGCVHVYQPMSGLHRPVVVDPQAPNLVGTSVRVVCPPGDDMSRGEARVLCERVGKLMEIQGARVTTVTDRPLGDEELGEEAAKEDTPPTTDLVLELRPHRHHTTNNMVSWVLCVATGTLVPGYTQSTFTQDVVVRDGTGFLLATDRLEGRLVRTFGLGTWFGNKLADLIWRKKEDELSKKQVYAEVSGDLYGQLSQLVFNARMRWEVLREATPEGRATGAPP